MIKKILTSISKFIEQFTDIVLFCLLIQIPAMIILLSGFFSPILIILVFTIVPSGFKAYCIFWLIFCAIATYITYYFYKKPYPVKKTEPVSTQFDEAAYRKYRGEDAYREYKKEEKDYR